jgi:hypothetical protein
MDEGKTGQLSAVDFAQGHTTLAAELLTMGEAFFACTPATLSPGQPRWAGSGRCVREISAPQFSTMQTGGAYAAGSPLS